MGYAVVNTNEKIAAGVLSGFSHANQSFFTETGRETKRPPGRATVD